MLHQATELRRSGRARLLQILPVFIFLAFSGSCFTVYGQTGEWGWMGGSSTIPAAATCKSNQSYYIDGYQCGQPGIYGQLGVASAANSPGGRSGMTVWTTGEGKFWLFGGQGVDSAGNFGHLNDLWQFDPATNEWTWMSGDKATTCVTIGDILLCDAPSLAGSQGVPAAGNVPAGRYFSFSWIDASGNLWLYGGLGTLNVPFAEDGLNLSDLWKFDPGTAQWTWVNGSTDGDTLPGFGTVGVASSASSPGSRWGGASWTDASGNLWLFGGISQTALEGEDFSNDLWTFNPGTGEWTWMGGDTNGGNCRATSPLGNICNDRGVYGAMGVASASNFPGGRVWPVTWTDDLGNLWMFGGDGFDAAGTMCPLNDFWKYTPASKMWIWMGGESTCPTSNSGYAGSYGNIGVPNPGNYPGSRESAAGTVDSGGNFWIFGGLGNGSTSFCCGFLDDLWEYSTISNEWTWTGGSDSENQVGSYGVLGTPEASNFPAGRGDSVAWLDRNGNLWIFGGFGLDSQASSGYLNDMWEFVPALSTVAAPTFTPPAGTYTSAQTVTIADSTSNTTIYYAINATPTTSSTQYAGPITVSSSETIEAIAVAPDSSTSAVSSAAYTIKLPAATPTFNPPAGTYTSAQTVAIADSTSNATIYYAINATPTSSSAQYSSPITVSSSETIEAIAVAPGSSTSAVASAVYSITSASTGTGEWTWLGGSSTIPNGYGVPGNYGTLGVPAAGNIPGGRAFVTTWTDKSGNLWLFGGEGANTTLIAFSDLWEFNPSTNEWAWMKGPGVVTCAITCKEPGVYGTLGKSDAANYPGGRWSTASWEDTSGNLWLYGGDGYDANGEIGLLNDLWKYDISNNQWTWMGGSSTLGTPNQGLPPVYGNLGTFESANNPGGRWASASWTDDDGHFWLFGGQGDYAVDVSGEFNDLWEFDPSINEWAWMGGSDTAGSNCGTGNCLQSGVYGTPGVPAAGNIPGSRNFSAAWTDANGHLWLFGGSVPGIQLSYLNDLWEYYPLSNEWAWMGGVSMVDQPGVYGAPGNPAAGNFPGSRCCMVSWTDASGHLWLFAGQGYDADGDQGDLNDLWEFNPSTSEWVWIDGSSTVTATTNSQPGIYGNLGVPAPNNIPGGRADSAGWTDRSGNFWLFGGSGTDANDLAGNLNDLWRYGAEGTNLPVAATPTFDPPAGTYTSAQSVTIADATPNATIYYAIDATPTTSSAQYSSPITVSNSETIEAIAVAPGSSTSNVASAAYIINLPAATPTFNPPAGTYTSAQSVTIADATPNATIYYAINATPTTSSAQYSSPIAVSTSETIEAIAAGPDSSISALASAAYVINLPQPNFTLGASPQSLTVSRGSQGTVTLTLTPQNGFDGTVAFGCSGLPTGTNCAFSPSTVAPTSGPVTTQLTFETSATSAAVKHPRVDNRLPALILAALLGVFGWRKRRNLKMLAVVVAVFAAIGLTGCTATLLFKSHPVISTVTITATSGAIQQTTTVTLTLNE